MIYLSYTNRNSYKFDSECYTYIVLKLKISSVKNFTVNPLQIVYISPDRASVHKSVPYILSVWCTPTSIYGLVSH